MSIPTDLDRRFRDAAARSGMLDAGYDLVETPLGELLVERFAPDRQRAPGRVARTVVVLGMTGFVLFAVTGIAVAYSEPSF